MSSIFPKLGIQRFFLLEWLLIKAEEFSLPYYLTYSWGKKRWIHTMFKNICMKLNLIESRWIQTQLIDFWSWGTNY